MATVFKQMLAISVSQYRRHQTTISTAQPAIQYSFSTKYISCHQ